MASPETDPRTLPALSRPIGSWPAWAMGVLFLLGTTVNVAAGVSVLYFRQTIHATSQRFEQSVAHLAEGTERLGKQLESMGVKIERNTERLSALDVRLAEYDTILRQVTDHEERLRELEQE